MTPKQIQLVQESFGKVVPIAEDAAMMFYDRLFELNPDLRPLFKSGDIKSQGRKLMSTLKMVILSLSELEKMVPAVQDLGRRHVDYGVKDEDYDTVGEALLWTLDKGLGKEFTPEVKEAWETVYGLLAGTMKGAPVEQTAHPAK